MTNDGFLIFDNMKERDKGMNLLKDLSLQSSNKKLFFVEILDDRRVFINLILKIK